MSDTNGVGEIVKSRRGTIIASGIAFLATSVVVVSAFTGAPVETSKPKAVEPVTQQAEQVQVVIPEKLEESLEVEDKTEEAQPIEPSPSVQVQTKTAPIVVPEIPLKAQPAPACSCPAADLDCGDFSSCSEAQAVYQCCLSQGKGDKHGLDRDKDGTACDTLCR